MSKYSYFFIVLLLVSPHALWAGDADFWPVWALFASFAALVAIDAMCDVIRASGSVIRVRAEIAQEAEEKEQTNGNT